MAQSIGRIITQIDLSYDGFGIVKTMNIQVASEQFEQRNLLEERINQERKLRLDAELKAADAILFATAALLVYDFDQMATELYRSEGGKKRQREHWLMTEKIPW